MVFFFCYTVNDNCLVGAFYKHSVSVNILKAHADLLHDTHGGIVTFHALGTVSVKTERSIINKLISYKLNKKVTMAILIEKNVKKSIIGE